MANNRRIGILLVNMGGATKLLDIPVFIFKLLSDPNVLRMTAFGRYSVAFLAALLRTPVLYFKYKRIGWSPIIEVTRRQSILLEDSLKKMVKDADFKVSFSMMYSRPYIESVISEFRGVDFLVFLPLYPQFSLVTTGAVEDRVERLIDSSVKYSVIKHFYDEENFVKAWACELSGIYSKEYVIFCAHSIPERLEAEGDPYRFQVLKTAELIADAAGVKEYSVAFQSMMRKKGWLGPSVYDVMKQVRKRGVDRLVLVPVSFVSEHLETMYELDIEYKNAAKALGFSVYKRVGIPQFSHFMIEAWANKVMEALCDAGVL